MKERKNRREKYQISDPDRPTCLVALDFALIKIFFFAKAEREMQSERELRFTRPREYIARGFGEGNYFSDEKGQIFSLISNLIPLLAHTGFCTSGICSEY